ncbi:MAG: hypothetical protein QME75_10605 [Deltaproteobacteria bacterium]|nr:hypothetical protein [Deltaproteobacteria bacterium]
MHAKIRQLVGFAPHDSTPREYYLEREVEKWEEEAEKIRDAWDSWMQFNLDFHALTPPPEIAAAWGKVREWLEAQASLVHDELYSRKDQLDRARGLG